MTVTHPLLAPLGLVIAAVVVLDAALGEVGFGLRGRSLALASMSAVFLLSAAAFLLWRRAPTVGVVVLLALLAASVVAMHAVDPTGPVIGLMLLAAFAPLRPPHAVATALTVAATLAFNVTQVVVAGETLVLTIATDAAVVFFHLLGTLLRKEQQQRERGDRLLAELEASRAAEREAVAEAARAGLARELHDVLAHTLSGLTIQLSAARLMAADRAVDRELRGVIERSHDLARAGVVEARRAVAALRGERLPGPDELADLVEEHKLASGAPAVLTVSGEPRPLQPEEGLTLYRTAQEALTNARKHARGAAVRVTLEWRPGGVVLTVRNEAASGTAEGDRGPLGGGFGLQGMAERARLIGAELVAAPTSDGFQVRLSIPYRHPATKVSEPDHRARQERVALGQDGEHLRESH